MRKTFESITSKLKAKGIPFEEVSFTDQAVSARTTDTSENHNYDPETVIKTLVISTSDGYKAVILKGSDRIDQPKLKAIVGKWSVVDAENLENKLGYIPGTICPLDLDLPVLIDEAVTTLKIWSMGAGANNKGLNIATEVVIKNLTDYKIISIKQ